jgi:hypothetical protein
MNSKPFNILKKHATPETLAIFDSVNAKYEVLDDEKVIEQGEDMPWANIEPGRSAFPFIVSAKYEFCKASTLGQGGTVYSFCLFGYIIYSWESVEWFS